MKIKTLLSILYIQKILILSFLFCVLFKNSGLAQDFDLSTQKDKFTSPIAEQRLRAVLSLTHKTDKQAIEILISALKDNDREVRECAAFLLGSKKDTSAVLPLIEDLKNNRHQYIMKEIIYALGELKDPRSIKPLISIFNKRITNDYASSALIGDYDNLVIRTHLVEALVKFEENVIESFIDSLQYMNPNIQTGLIEVIKELKEPKTVTTLLKMLNGTPEVRKEVMLALGEIKDTRAIDPLIRLLGYDYFSDSHELIISTLAKIKDPRTVDPLINILLDKKSKLREQAAWALGEIKNPHAVEPLIAALDDKKTNVREQAACALGEIKDTRAVEPLITALNDKKTNVRAQAAWALGEIKDSRAAYPLLSALCRANNDEIELTEQIAIAIGKININMCVKLKELLESEDLHIKYGAARTLEELGDTSIVDEFLSMMEDDNSVYANRALKSLGRLKEPRAIQPLIEKMHKLNLGWRSFLLYSTTLAKIIPIDSSLFVDNYIKSFINNYENFYVGYIVKIPAKDSLCTIIRNIDSLALDPLIYEISIAENSNVRRGIALALSQINHKKAKEILDTAMIQKDLDIIAGAYRYFIHKGGIRTEDVLIDAYKKYRIIEMDEDLLNCGNPLLKQVAINKGKGNIYGVSYSSGFYCIKWGLQKPILTKSKFIFVII